MKVLDLCVISLSCSLQDFDEHGIAPRKYAASSTFTSEERKRKRDHEILHQTGKSTLDLGTSLIDLIVPEK